MWNFKTIVMDGMDMNNIRSRMKGVNIWKAILLISLRLCLNKVVEIFWELSILDNSNDSIAIIYKCFV